MNEIASATSNIQSCSHSKNLLSSNNTHKTQHTDHPVIKLHLILISNKLLVGQSTKLGQST